MKSFLHKLPFLCLFFVAFGSRAQVTKLSNNTNLEIAIPLGNFAVLISRSDSLWRTDGTPAGTFKYATNVAVSSTFDYVVLGNKIYFSGVDANGTELWVTDGTAGGTKMVKDINTGGDSDPRYLTVYNNNVFFFADNGTDGAELWKSDGSLGGTSMVKNINATGGSIPAFVLPPPINFTQELGVSYFTKNNLLYFTAMDGANGAELWQTNGTSGGTVIVKDINSGTASSFPQTFYEYGSVFLFSAYTADNGRELWKTDGTADGTVLVKDIDPSNKSLPAYAPNIFGFTTFKNKVYFNASEPTHASEGWVTDGTTDGTVLLKDFNANKGNGFPFFVEAIFANNQMIFPATSANEGTELWASDGTSENTNLFKDINPGKPSSNPAIALNGFGSTDVNSFHSNLYHGFLFLSAKTPDGGTVLWKTDGTSGGTIRVKDINPGTDSSMGGSEGFFNLYLSDAYYFTATDGSHGYELWKSNGTDGSTVMVKDIFTTTDSSSFPQFVGYFNGIVLFSAHDGDNANGNRDLFRLDGVFNAPLPINLLDFTGAVRDRSVRLNWSTSQEVNTAYFDVERSTNGSDFKPVGKVVAQKNTTTKKNYTFDDASALTSESKIYYRLKMVDEDGKFKYSKVVAFSKLSEGHLLTYPNPVMDELKVTINSGNRRQLSLTIFDETGKQVYAQRLTSLQGNNSYSINVSSFAKGSYYVNVITDGGVETSKFVKK